MGSPAGVGHDDEHPRHPVRITRPFLAGVTPVRWCNALSAAEKRPTAYTIGTGNTPDVKVDLAAPGYRLPTEAEWEYLCRAGTGTRWSFGDDEAALGDHAWFTGNAGGTTHPVGEKRPNPWGLYDVHGNVWEWTGDNWFRRYTKQPVDDPFLPPAVGDGRVIRGGSWNDAPVWCRSAYRVGRYPDDRYLLLGFRVVLPLPRDA